MRPVRAKHRQGRPPHRFSWLQVPGSLLKPPEAAVVAEGIPPRGRKHPCIWFLDSLVFMSFAADIVLMRLLIFYSLSCCLL